MDILEKAGNAWGVLNIFINNSAFISLMPTINDIVNGLIVLYGLKERKLQGKGFDYKFSSAIESSDTAKPYSNDDAVFIERIVDELVRNAYKAIYGVEDPHRIENNENLKKIKGRIELKLTETDTHYVISCQDNGDGIPEDNKKRIFVKGFSTRGTNGYGLYLVTGYVYQLGGKLSFESEPGKGTTFYVKLPKQT